MHASRHYTLYGLRLSYFTRKLEAALELMGVPFAYEPKTMELREELERRAGTHQMPVIRTPEDWVIADSTPIIDLLDGRFPSRRLFPVGPLGVLVHVVEELFDEWITRTAVHFRWQYPESDRFAAEGMAEETLPDGDAATRQAMGGAIADWGRRACRALGMSSERQKKSAEEELDGLLAALDEQLGSTRYALGDRPCAVDAVLLGALRAHFLTDPTPRARFERHGRVVAWVDRASTWDGGGELAPFPESTPFATAALRVLATRYAPFVLGNAEALAQEQKAFVARIDDEEVSYRTRPYPERSRQMVRERIERGLDGEERRWVERWLAAVGLAEVFG